MFTSGLVLAIACGLSACGSVSATADAGVDDGGSDAASDGNTDGAGGSDAPAHETATAETCAACVNLQCKSAWDACIVEKPCTDRLDCLRACTDSACQTACTSAHPSINADAVVACLTGVCHDACTNTVKR